MPIQEVIQPITCPQCGSILTLRLSEQTFYCMQEHHYSALQLDEALKKQLAQTLNITMRQIREGQILAEAMQKSNLIPAIGHDTLIPHARKVLSQITKANNDQNIES